MSDFQTTNPCSICGKFVDAFEADEHGQHPACTAWWGSSDDIKKVWNWAWDHYFPEAAINE